MLYRRWGSDKDFVISYTSSSESDKEIVEEVKLTLKAHSIELYLSNYISKDTAKKIIRTINSFKDYTSSGYEDVHEALEDYIIKNIGEEGGWVGLGRSRNDHVATALRLRTREYIFDILEELYLLRKSLIDQAKKNLNTIMPSYTHFQPAQPTTLAHYFMYLEEELNTPWETLFNSLKLINRSPLGSGAIVGSNVKIDRKREAELLGFDDVLYNTISSTSSRIDFISVISSLALLMLVLGRFAEDMILLSSMFVNIIKLPDSHVSTSSLMPQKRNSVTMEILRTKVGECYGDLSSLIVIYKGLPSGYNLDLQEMNKHYWNCIKHVIPSIHITRDIIQNIQIKNFGEIQGLTATDLAEEMAISGIPYRKAYIDVANKIKAGTFVAGISYTKSIENKKVIGSPNPSILTQEIEIKEKRLDSQYEKFKQYKENVIEKMGQLGVIEDGLLQ
ncbi:argininosuccinate lyase [Sulfolobus acidocaldarius SUSAZ]|nr:argininosuccinate lyase [Sulfolobus acidocaldarius SUSAZ]